MKTPPWLLPLEKARPIYAKLLREMQWLERLAKMAGRNVRPKQ